MSAIEAATTTPAIETTTMPISVSSDAPVYLAVDIEKVDDYQSSPIVAFGVCLGDAHGVILESHAWYPAMPKDGKFGERCKAEFWDKQPGLYERFAERAGDTATVYVGFAAWLNGLEARYSNITILSDNPAYDLSSLDRQLERYCSRLPTRYTSLGKYRWVSDWSERADRLGCYGKVKARVATAMAMAYGANIADYAHNPEVDAEQIYRCSVLTEVIGGKVRAELDKLIDKAFADLPAMT